MNESNSRRILRSWISRKIPAFIKDWLFPNRQNRLTPIYGIGRTPPGGSPNGISPKRALLSYVTTPFRLPLTHPVNINFSNAGIARSIVRVLNELGYVVDIVEWSDISFVPHRKYDLFIGHGGMNYEHIARNLPSRTVKVYFSTGLYWRECNRRESERFRQLEERRGIRLPYDRWISHDEEYANESADGIICLGNHVAKESYSKFPLVLNLNNAAYQDDHYDRTKKDFAAGRDKFLFFAGPGNVHKGLDILLEAFVQVDPHLYVRQDIHPDFLEAYDHELNDHPNIHLVGRVSSTRSDRFYDLVNRCNYVISASCAEGQPGAVVECMHQGLIPVLSRETNIDTNEFGITLKTCSIEEIAELVNRLSQRPTEWCQEMSRRTRHAALTDFSESAFLLNMKRAIQRVISRE